MTLEHHNGPETYAVIEYAPQERGLQALYNPHNTFGVMAYAAPSSRRARGDDEPGPIPLGIDAHWHSRAAAERALTHYVEGTCVHGRSTEADHNAADAADRNPQ